MLSLDRRRLAHVAVTAHPTAAWTAQQLREAFPNNEAPRFLLHDRDSAFAAVHATIGGMGIRQLEIAPRSPQGQPVSRVAHQVFSMDTWWGCRGVSAIPNRTFRRIVALLAFVLGVWMLVHGPA